jgi:hypothetical protein
MQRHYVNYNKGEQLYEANRRETALAHPRSWVCLMMRLKSFRPEVDKSWCVTERMPKKKEKKSPMNNFKTKMIS